MAYFVGRCAGASQGRRSDKRPVLENAGRAARFEKWWRRRCGDPSAAEELHDLSFQVASDPRTLARVFQYLSRHGGQAPGLDRCTYDDLAGCHGGVWRVCRGLSDALRSNAWRASELRLVNIEKRDGGTRTLCLPSVIDRIVGRAVAATLMPLMAPRFSDAGYGGLPGRGPSAAFARVFRELAVADRYVWVSMDVRQAFDSIDRSRLLDLFSRFPRPLVDLLAQLSRTHRRKGFPQGGPCSPLLLHVYLDHFLDRPFRRMFPQTPLVRYMDDVLVLCRSRRVAKLAHAHVTRLLQDAGLKLKPGDQIADIRTTPVQWLGMRIRRGNHFAIDAEIIEDSWKSLADGLRRCQIKGRPAMPVVLGWLAYHAIAFRRARANDVIRRVRQLCRIHEIEPPPAKELAEHWRDSWLNVSEAAGGHVFVPA